MLAIAVVLATGYVQGEWTNRWAVKTDHLKEAADRLQRVGLSVGDWRGQSYGEEMKDLIQEEKNVVYITRRYTSQRTGESLSVLLMCGDSDQVSTHPPEACYTASGYEIAEPRVRNPRPGGNSFWLVKFRKPGPAVDVNLDVYYAWSENGTWEAPKWDPRMRFARSPVVYKLYVIREAGVAGRSEVDAVTSFMDVFLPEIRLKMFSAAKS